MLAVNEKCVNYPTNFRVLYLETVHSVWQHAEDFVFPSSYVKIFITGGAFVMKLKNPIQIQPCRVNQTKMDLFFEDPTLPCTSQSTPKTGHEDSQMVTFKHIQTLQSENMAFLKKCEIKTWACGGTILLKKRNNKFLYCLKLISSENKTCGFIHEWHDANNNLFTQHIVCLCCPKSC